MAARTESSIRGRAPSVYGPFSRSIRPQNTPISPCFSLKSRYIRPHLTRKHGCHRPSGGNRAEKARIAHTLPEEPTGELNDGATRFFHASAVRSWRAFWPPIAPLESENV